MSPARRHPTRRALVTGGAAAVAAGALVPAPVAALQLDRDLIDLLFNQELTQIAHYEAILQAFDEAAFVDAGLPENARSAIEEILAAEAAHLTVVTRPDGPRVSGMAATIPGDVRDALREAAELENLAVASYAFVIPELGKQRLIPALLGIHSVDARHASWLATLLGEEPFPDTIDTPLTLEESTAELDGTPGSPTAMATPVTDIDIDIEPIVGVIVRELNVSAEEIEIVDVTPQVWPDSSLGCPRPDMLYAQVITPGYQIVVEVGGEQIAFHTDERGTVVRCP